MKNIYFLFLVICIIGLHNNAYAQYSALFKYFPTGHVFPNVVLETMVGFDGQIPDTSYLYDVADEGKPVIVFLYVANDSLAWNYHNSNSLQNLYNTHGSIGDNTINIIGLNLSGYWPFVGEYNPDNPTLGDWSANTSYPVYEGWHTWNVTLHKLQWPQVFCVCPDRRAYRLGLWSADSLYEAAMNCGLTTAPIDAQIIWSDVDTMGNCVGDSRSVNAFLSNMGTEAITSATIEVRANGQVIQSYPWAGNLSTYHIDTIALNALPTSGQPIDLQLVATNINGASDANNTNDTLSYHLNSAAIWNIDTLSIDIRTYGGQYLYWELNDENDITIDSGGYSLLASNPYHPPGGGGDYYPANTLIHETVSLLGHDHACMTMKVISSTGLGVYPSNGSPDDYFFRVKRGEEVIFEWVEWSHFAYGQIYTDFSYAFVTATYDVVNTTNAAPNGSITITAAAGVAPYQYSIDCGATYSANPVFSGLLAGSYCIAVMDAMGQVVTDTVIVDNLSATDAALYGNAALLVQPNPAKNEVQVLLSGLTEPTVAQFQLLNADGQTLQQGNLQQQGKGFQGILSLSALPSGMYFVRVITPLTTRIAKVIKSE